MKKKYIIGGMTCSSCVSHVEESVKSLKEVESCSVNLISKTLYVEGSNIDDNMIKKVVTAAGYEFLSSTSTTQEKPKDSNNFLMRLIVSFVFLIPLFYLSMGHMLSLPIPSFLHGSANALTFSFLQLLLVTPILFVNRTFFIKGTKSLFKGHPTMDTLITIGSLAAVIYGIAAIFVIGYGLGHNDLPLVERYSTDLYFEAAGTVLSLVTLGKYFEEKAKSRTTNSIKKIMDLAPDTATVIRDGSEVIVALKDVVLGDTIILKAGERAPVDGIVLSGSASFDEAAMSGEPLPVYKELNGSILSGTTNISGAISYKATKIGEETTINQIIKLVEEANSSKPAIAEIADKIAKWFVPFVIIIAVISFAVWLIVGKTFDFSLSIFIAVLVISCPCALGLATPLAVMLGTGLGAEHGILIKNAESIELLKKSDVVVFDKTGTLTIGKPKVERVISSISEEEAMSFLYTLENDSSHPLSSAIVEYALAHSISLLTSSSFSEIAGRGVKAKIDEVWYFAGNEKFITENNITIDPLFTTVEGIKIFLARDNNVLAVVELSDQIKDNAREVVLSLQQMNKKVILLTGDNAVAARKIQEQLNLDEFISDVLPQEKNDVIIRLQKEHHIVTMIGDGINDSIALSRADVGISFKHGTDIAIDSSDLILMRDDLMDIVKAIYLSKKIVSNIKQNLFWAFAYNTLCIPIAAGVLIPGLDFKLNPMIAGLAMSMSSLFVVLNSFKLRLLSKLEIKKEKFDMKKTFTIEGMNCKHCVNRVETALNEIDGITATVSLEKKNAEITFTKDIADEVIINKITQVGYKVIK